MLWGYVSSAVSILFRSGHVDVRASQQFVLGDVDYQLIEAIACSKQGRVISWSMRVYWHVQRHLYPHLTR